MDETVLAYHFVGNTLRDDAPIPADGEWLEYSGKVVMCQSGLHASEHPFDALQYAPGDTLCLVECDDIVDTQEDKLVCRRRKIIARFDAEPLLWEASRSYALSVIHLWDAPQVVKDYLETGDESLRAAAWDSARADAGAAAARAAAGAATWADAGAAAAWAATWAAAGAAAGTASGAAAGAAAARAAAGADAGAAAGAAQKTQFLDAVHSEFISMGVDPLTGEVSNKELVNG